MNLLRLPNKEELIYPREIITFIVFSLLLFLFFFFIGLNMAINNPSFVGEQMNELKKMVEGVADLSAVGLLLFIFFNNSFVALLASLGGVIFSLLPLVVIMSNGFLIGIVFHYISSSFSWQFFIGGIMPHGFLELPVIFFSTAMGIWLGRSFFGYLFLKTETKSSLFFKIKRVFYTYVFVIVPFLFLAAMIESFITPYVIKLFFDVDLLL